MSMTGFCFILITVLLISFEGDIEKANARQTIKKMNTIMDTTILYSMFSPFYCSGQLVWFILEERYVKLKFSLIKMVQL